MSVGSTSRIATCQVTSSGPVVVELGDDGEHGYSEDVTDDSDDQYALIEDIEPFPNIGAFTLSEFSETIGSLFYPDTPIDIALSEYTDPEPQARLPMNPLQRQWTHTV